MLFIDKQLNSYFKTIPLSFKIILIIIVFRPLLTTLEETLPGLPISLLEIVGGLIFIVMLFNIISTRQQWTVTSITIYKLFFVIYSFNLFLILVSYPNFNIFSHFVKVFTPAIMFFFFIRTINNESDLNLLFKAFLISLIPFLIVVIYDVVFVGSYDVTRRDMARLHTSYGDVMTVGVLINIIYSIILYKLLEDDSWFGRRKYLFLSFYLLFSIFLLIKISHAASIGVFVGLTLIYIIYNFPRKKISILALILLLTVPIYYIFGDLITEFYNGIYLMEYEIVVSDTGSFNNDMILHGRGGRWRNLYALFLDQNLIQIFFGGMGVSLPALVVSSAHNDFLRILFLTGIIGLILYLLFIFSIIILALKRGGNYKYLISLTMVILLPYSITLTPSVYMDWNLYFMAVIAYLIRK